jgi:hypothetical protein
MNERIGMDHLQSAETWQQIIRIHSFRFAGRDGKDGADFFAVGKKHIFHGVSEDPRGRDKRCADILERIFDDNLFIM